MNRNFWTITIGQAISLLGTSFGQIAQAWLVYSLTGSKLAMGTIILAATVPETLLRLLGGPLVDRWNRVALMRSLDVIQTFLYAAPPLLAATGLLRLWHLYLFAVSAGLARALYMPAYFALVPSVVPKEQLVRANSVAQTLTQAGMLIGPAVAGGLVASVGPIPALTIDAISYGCSALALFLIPLALGQSEQRPKSTESYASQLIGGLTFYRQVPLLVVIMATVMAINFAVAGWNSMEVPFVAERVGASAEATGLASAAMSGGILLGGLLIGRLGDRWRNRYTLLVPDMVGGLAMMALALVGHGGVIPMVLLVGIVGMGIGVFNPQSGALYQRLVPDELRGRVMSVRLTLAWGIMPLGSFLGGLVADRAGLTTMLVAFGLVPVVVTLGALFSPALGALEAQPGAEEIAERAAA